MNVTKIALLQQQVAALQQQVVELEARDDGWRANWRENDLAHKSALLEKKRAIDALEFSLQKAAERTKELEKLYNAAIVALKESLEREENWSSGAWYR